MTSSTDATDHFKIGSGGLSDLTITLENYLILQETATGNGQSWVTATVSQDYFDSGENPVLTIDFGSSQTLNTILLWGNGFNSGGYVHGNFAKVFDLEIFDSATNNFILVETGFRLRGF